MVRDIREAFLIYLKGFLMGCADSVPGVSGGTIALITGIYDRLISAITSINPDNTSRFARSVIRSEERLEPEIIFLAVLGSGILSAVLLTLNLVNFMISSYLVVTYSFFFGLISASILSLKHEVTLDNSKRKIAMFTGFAVAYILSGYSTLTFDHGGLILFLSGGVAVTAMVLPGISGSLILLILGQYEYITELVSEFTSSIWSSATSGNFLSIIKAAMPLIIFASGGIIGLLTASRAVEKALEKDRKTTMTFLVGMVIGSLRAPLLRVSQHLSSNGIGWLRAAPEAVLASLIGAGVIILLHRLTDYQDF